MGHKSADWMTVYRDVYDQTFARHLTIGGLGVVGHVLQGQRWPTKLRRPRKARKRDDKRLWDALGISEV